MSIIERSTLDRMEEADPTEEWVLEAYYEYTQRLSALARHKRAASEEFRTARDAALKAREKEGR